MFAFSLRQNDLVLFVIMMLVNIVMNICYTNKLSVKNKRSVIFCIKLD